MQPRGWVDWAHLVTQQAVQYGVEKTLETRGAAYIGFKLATERLTKRNLAGSARNAHQGALLSEIKGRDRGIEKELHQALETKCRVMVGRSGAEGRGTLPGVQYGCTLGLRRTPVVRDQ